MEPSPGSLLRKGVTYNAIGIVQDCLFCRILGGKEPAQIVKDSEQFVAFKTIAPASPYHLLISPRKHIQNIHALCKADVALIHELKAFGLSALTADQQSSGVQMSFHRPPYNSIDHLHLHVIAYKSQMSWVGYLKYMTGTPWCIDVDALIEQLRNKN